MRQITDFSTKWTMNATAPGAMDYEPCCVNLPFICDAEKINHITIHKNYKCDSAAEKMLFLECCGITGNACVYCNGKKLISHTGAQTDFTVCLSEELADGAEFTIRLEINPRPRNDGKVIIGKISLIEVGEYRFDGSRGQIVTTDVNVGNAVLRYSPVTTSPTNYDIITAKIIGDDGNFIGVKSCKATANEMQIPIPSEYIYSDKNTVFVNIEASLLRDTSLLDSINLTVGVTSRRICDGVFDINGKPVTVSGVSLADFSSVKKDISLMKQSGFNSLQFGGLTAKNSIFTTLDTQGIIGWYNLPYTGRRSDIDSLREVIRQNYHHPSFCFAVCSCDADEAYVKEFTETVRSCPGHIIPALRYDIMSEKPLPDCSPEVIVLSVYCRGKQVDFDALEENYTRISQSVSPDTVFVVDIIPPECDGIGGIGEYECCRRQRQLYTLFSKKARVTGWFAGDIRSGVLNNGMYGKNGESLTDKMFRAINSRSEYLKIEADDKKYTSDKNCSLVVFSNNPAFKVLVNSKMPKQFTVEELAKGIYRIGNLRLTGKINLIEISSGEQCDNITVYRG